MKCLKLVAMAIVIANGTWAATDGSGLEALKARFRERLPGLDRLKAVALVGETEQGYVEFVGAGRQQEALVAAENADRKALYEAIAGQTGATADLVGRRRAAQIAAEAPAGTYLRDASGKWQRKPAEAGAERGAAP